MIIRALRSVSTWIVGLSQSLLSAAQTGASPPLLFRKRNQYDMILSLLIVQAVILSILSCMFIFMPTVNSAYWVLSVMFAQVYLIMYLLMFAAAISSRIKILINFDPIKFSDGIWVYGSCVL